MKNERLLKTRGLFLALAALMSAFAFSGCIESDPPMIDVSKHSIQTGCEAQSISVTVTSNARWTAASNSSWVTLSRTEGTNTEELDLILEACDASQSRMAVITLKTEGRNETQTTITVSQSAKNAVLQIAPSAVTAGAAAQNVAFAIASNTEWTVTSTSDWAAPKMVSGSGNAIVTVALAENSSHTADREAKIVVSAGNEVERTQSEFTITQISRELPSIFLTHNTLSFAANAKTAGTNVANIPIVTNITGDVKVTSEFSWCDATYSNGVVTVTVQDNTANEPRTCIVTVFADVEGSMVMKQILVTQAGVGAPTLTMVNTNIVLPSFSGDPNSQAQTASIFYLPSSEDIAVSVEKDYPSWISDVAVDKTHHLITFKVAANESSSPRETTLSVIAKIGDQTMAYPVAVTQQGVGELKLVLATKSVGVSAAGETFTVDAFVNSAQATITAYSANASWTTVQTKSTSNSFGISSVLTVTVAENASADPRSSEIIVPVKAGDQMIFGTISVIQDGVGAPEASVTESNVNFPKAGGSYTVSVFGADANTTVQAVVPASWVKATVTKDNVTFTATQNNSSASRSTTADLIVTRGGKTQVIPIDIRQAGTGSAELVIAQNSYTFAQVGATYEIPIESENGTTYEVISTPDWIATESMEKPDGIKAVVASNTSADKRMGDIVILANNGDDYTYYIISTTQKGLMAPDIALGQTEIVIPRTATVGTEGYAVTVAGADASTTVKATSDQPWVKGIVSADKTSIALAAQENKASEKRTATISVVAERGGEEEILSFAVVQPGTGSAELRIAVADYTFGPKEIKEFDIPVTALNGTSYTVASKPEFVTVSGEGSPMLKIALTSNEATTESRSGVIVLKAVNGSDEIQYSISIKQLGVNGPNVQAAIYSVVVPRTAIEGFEGYDVALIGIDAATSLKTASTATWISGYITETHALSFKTEENTSSEKRVAVVSVIAERGGEQQIISVQVTQPGTGTAELELAVPDYTFPYMPVDSFAVPVTMLHGTKYTVAAKPDWLTVGGEGTNTLYLSMPKNTVVDLRSGTVILRATNGSDETEYTIGVTQLGIDGPHIFTDMYKIILPSEATDYLTLDAFGYDGDTKVTFIPNAPWFTAGFNDRKDKIWFNAQENTLTGKREALLTVQAEKGGQEQQFTIQVIQLGVNSPYLDILSDDIVFNADAVNGEINGFYKIPTKISVVEDPNYIASDFRIYQEPYSAVLGLFFIDFDMDVNNTVNDRTSTIVLRAEAGGETVFYNVKITQKGNKAPKIQVINPYQTVAAYPSRITSNIEGEPITFSNSVFMINKNGASYGTPSSTVNWIDNMRVITMEFISTLVFNCQDNLSNSPREGQISIPFTLNGETVIAKIYVTQLANGGAALNISDNEYAFGPEGFTDFFVGINCKSGVTYSIVNRPDFVGDDIHELADGSGLVFSVDPNTDAAERRGYITLVSQNGNEQATYVIGIVQAGISGPNITALGNMMELPASEVDLENYKIGISGVDGQTDVFIADNAEWLATGYDEEGNFVYFDAKENLTDQPRTAVATIVAFKNNQTQLIRIPVTQAAHSSVYTFTASPAPIFYDANGGDRDITIQLTGITYLKVDDATVPEWLDYDVSGTEPNFEDGTYNVVVTAFTNYTGVSRQANVVIRYGKSEADSRTFTMNVVQSASTDLYLSPGGGLTLLPATIPESLIRAPKAPSSDDPSDILLNPRLISVLPESPSASLDGFSSSASWLRYFLNYSAPAFRVSAESSNTSDANRIAYVNFQAQVAGSIQNMQAEVKQLCATEPQITGMTDVRTSEDYLYPRVELSGTGTASKVFSTKNVVSVDSHKTDGFLGFGGLSVDDYDCSTEFADGMITLTFTFNVPSVKKTIPAGSKSVVALTVSDGERSNTYYVQVVVPHDITIGPFDAPVFSSESPVTITNQTSYTVQWTGEAGVESYTLQYKDADVEEYTVTTVSGTSYDLAVSPGTRYDIQVKANANESLPYRTESAYSSMLLTDLPPAPTNLRATASTTDGNKITITWDTVENADRYLFLYTIPSTYFSSSQFIQDNSFIFSDAVAGTTYKFAVRVLPKNWTIASEWSPVISFTFPDGTAD